MVKPGLLLMISLQQHEFIGENTGPHLLITGGVHGDEFEPIAAIRRLIGHFKNSDSHAAGICGRVTFVPIVNEAAYLRGHRCADDGLDLARTCPGRPDGSITEQTAHALSELIRTADFYIDLHSGGTEFSVLPLAGYMLHADIAILETQRRMARAFNLPVVWGTSADLDGRSLSVARDADVPAIYCEYLGAATCSHQGVEAYVNGCLNVMTELKMLERDVPPNSVEYVIEDPRPASGHLQVHHPSPVDGLFEPAVTLGDAVDRGAPLGTVFDLHDGAAHNVFAEHHGIVLVLRTFPRVRRGDSVGVVLDLAERR
ncbi:MAG: succinylglutamate desuccinylase/aspartoacylase family protein [Planctomycetaceae bacterium]|nr:succinylglutamate desuccinylase/aspartoacylase family protein [Planctomycetaceae bacterium]